MREEESGEASRTSSRLVGDVERCGTASLTGAARVVALNERLVAAAEMRRRAILEELLR